MAGEEVAFIQEPRKTGNEGKERLVKGWLQQRAVGSGGSERGDGKENENIAAHMRTNRKGDLVTTTLNHFYLKTSSKVERATFLYWFTAK